MTNRSRLSQIALLISIPAGVATVVSLFLSYGLQERPELPEIVDTLAKYRTEIKITDDNEYKIYMADDATNTELHSVTIELARFGRPIYSLYAKSEEIDNLGAVCDIPEVQFLNFRDSNVRDLRALNRCTHLVKLILDGTRARDLEPIHALTELGHLDLEDTHVRELGSLQNLTKLQTLDLASTRVRELSPIQNLTNLEVLDVSQTKVSDLRPLRGLTSLRFLDIGHTDVEDLTPLFSLQRLRNLYLENTNVAQKQIAEIRRINPDLDIEF